MLKSWGWEQGKESYGLQRRGGRSRGEDAAYMGEEEEARLRPAPARRHPGPR